MGDYIRKSTAKKCPVHQAIFDEASTQLAAFGVFQKERVLKTTSLLAMAHSIRWDYIRDFIEEEQACELVPLAARYFKHHSVEEEHVNPGAFLAGGNGRNTAGYAAVVPHNDHLVVHKIARKRNIANGVGKAFKSYLEAVSNKRDATMLEDTPDE